ncbi:TPA: endonuclease MutS2, partial [Campylobacter coli]|nr:endonuclease MutS2 [Campylobacter coli]
KSVSLEFKKQVLIITGVNAGGKSMLLKSMLSAAFLAKHLLPMHIKASESKIGTFKEFDAIIEDPQNVKNDISTFAGRMLHFSRLFSKKNLLLGIDEIELGTDFEEAACLYSVLISKLIANNLKIIITTHHKRLAMLLAKNEQVELIAALYDEELSRPKYEFLKGTIGKSYAFETALRYQI